MQERQIQYLTLFHRSFASISRSATLKPFPDSLTRQVGGISKISTCFTDITEVHTLFRSKLAAISSFSHKLTLNARKSALRLIHAIMIMPVREVPREAQSHGA